MRKKMYGLISAIVVAAVIMTGCGGGSQKSETQKKAENTENTSKEKFETAKIKAGYMPNLGSAAIYITAEKMGLSLIHI